MKTTLALGPEVEKLIRDLMVARSISFEEALRFALKMELLGQAGEQEKHEQPTFRLGAGEGLRWDKSLELADAIEDHKLASRIESRK